MTKAERQVWIATYGAACAVGKQDGKTMAFLAVMQLRWARGDGEPVSPFSAKTLVLVEAMAREVLGQDAPADAESRCPKCGGEVGLDSNGKSHMRCLDCAATSPPIDTGAVLEKACMRVWKG